MVLGELQQPAHSGPETSSLGNDNHIAMTTCLSMNNILKISDWLKTLNNFVQDCRSNSRRITSFHL